MYNFPTNIAMSTVVATHTLAAVNDVLIAQFISEPIAAATITGTVKGIIRTSESNAANDCRAQMVIKVMSNDGTVERGVLLAENAGALSNEFATTLTNRKFPLNWAGAGTSLSSVIASENDRIVIEIGTRFHVTTTSITASFRLGDSAASDNLENETSTNDNRPWVEFSQDLVFNRNVNISNDVVDNIYTSDLNNNKNVQLTNLCGISGVSSTTFYVMRGKDIDCGGITYRTWTVTDEPDLTGALYSGPKCGASPLQDIVIVKKIVV